METASMPDANAGTEDRIQQLVEAELERIDTPEAAENVAQTLEREAAGATEEQRAEEAAASTADANEAIQRATAIASPTEQVAAVLSETAAQAVAPTPEAEQVLEGARRAAGTAAALASPRARRGRELLVRAFLRRMGPLDALDAELFLVINRGDRPGWGDRIGRIVALVANGGWIWAAGALLAWLCGSLQARAALGVLIPVLAVTNWVVEWPVKAFFRRRRPFIDVIRAVVVGKKPGTWSFPSGHTATNFAGALVASCFWPRLSSVFFTLAACVGLSRVYVGAHYPGDVLFGMLFGVGLSEATRRAVALLIALLARRVRPDTAAAFAGAAHRVRCS
jgi:undecaprenyl-diphosphatase